MIEHTFSHDKTLPELKKILANAFDFYKERYAHYDPTLHWKSENEVSISFAAKGFQIQGLLTLQDKEVHLSLEVPLFLRMFKSKAIEKIDSEMKHWLA